LGTVANLLGEIVDWHEVEAPVARVLRGRTVRLEPIDPDRHCRSLFEAAVGDHAIWDYLPHGPFEHEDEFRTWLQGAKHSSEYMFFILVDEATGRAEGMASYLRMVPLHGVIEIGYIWYGLRLQRTTAGTETIYLLLHHAFDNLGYRRVEWKCNALNQASRRAAERFAFTYEGVFRQHRVVRGRNRDTAWYAMLDREWPAVRRAFEAWLSPRNFDAEGRQHQSLSAIRNSIG